MRALLGTAHRAGACLEMRILYLEDQLGLDGEAYVEIEDGYYIRAAELAV